MSNPLVLDRPIGIAKTRRMPTALTALPTRTTEQETSDTHVSKATQHVAHLYSYSPVSQTVAVARAAEDILGISVPAGARTIRKLAALAELLGMHASMSSGALSGPDGLPIYACLSPEYDRADLSSKIGSFALQVLKQLCSSANASTWIVPGGVYARPVDASWRPLIDRARQLRAHLAQCANEWHAGFDAWRVQNQQPTLPGPVIALTTDEGNWSLDGTRLRIIDTSGKTMECCVDPEQFDNVIGTTPAHQVATLYYKPHGATRGRFVSGPLARIHVAEHMGTPDADAALLALRTRFTDNFRKRSMSLNLAPYARQIEMIAALESIEGLLSPLGATSSMLSGAGSLHKHTGVGMHEAPFGTLIVRLTVDADGDLLETESMGT